MKKKVGEFENKLRMQHK